MVSRASSRPPATTHRPASTSSNRPTVSPAGPKVTSGRDGGVKPEASNEEDTGSHPKLAQGETLSGLSKGPESENAKDMKKMININGGNLVDPAYREVGDGGEAGNKGGLGNEKPQPQGANGGTQIKGRDSKL